jgi:hypothetical protein
MSVVQAEEVVRENLRMLSSKEAREVAMCESVGGNAGPGCYVLNLEVDGAGRIRYVGNDPDRTNAAIRVFTPAFFIGVKQLDEMVLDVFTGGDGAVKLRLAASAWLWNLHRIGKERDLVDRFLEGKLGWAELLELLRSKYPQLEVELA